MKNRVIRGFTLIELVLVIAILGILAVVALPTIFDTTLGAARSNTAAATASAISAGLGIYAGDQIAQGRVKSYPADLDSASAGIASASNPMFGNVLSPAVTERWIKKTATGKCYIYNVAGTGTEDATVDIYYQYDSTAGTFNKVTSTTCS